MSRRTLSLLPPLTDGTAHRYQTGLSEVPGLHGDVPRRVRKACRLAWVPLQRTDPDPAFAPNNPVSLGALGRLVRSQSSFVPRSGTYDVRTSTPKDWWMI